VYHTNIVVVKKFEWMGQIKVLDPLVVAKVRSGFVIQSLAQGIEECVCNSLDAGATEIVICVDGDYDSFQVEDNGIGIPSESFPSLALRFATSKISGISDLTCAPQSYGFRGEALSSLGECSVLQITSKAQGQFQTWTKVVSGAGFKSAGFRLCSGKLTVQLLL
jgi:DNA mismatch repair ATPase MutL